MLIDREGIRLRGAQTVYTLCARDAFRVVQGRVHIYLVEHSQEGMSKRDACVGRVDAGSALVIPAFASMSGDDEMWCFAIEADAQGAELLRVPFEEEQLERFLCASGAPSVLPGLLKARLPHIPGNPALPENPQEDTLLIPEASSFVADCPEESYCVESGAVYVFLVPVTESGLSERKEFLCRAEPGDGFAIPGLHHEADGRLWQLRLEAENGPARLLRMGCTRVAREKFLLAVQAQSCGGEAEREFLMEAWLHEGFGESLVQYYVHRTGLADAIRESRQFRHREDIQQRVQSAIRSGTGEKSPTGRPAKAPLIQALRHLCRRGGIPLAEEKLAQYRPGMPLPELARQCGLLCREVELEGDWFREDIGLLLGRLDSRPVVCIPREGGGYRLYDPAAGREVRLDAQLAGQMHARAYAIGRALPNGSLCRRDIFLFMLRGVRRAELLEMALLAALCLPALLLLPLLLERTLDLHIPMGDSAALAGACLTVCLFMLSRTAFSLLAGRKGVRICARAGRELQNAMLARVFELPERLIARYESGQLAQLIQSFGHAAGRAAAQILTLGASAACAPIFLLQMAHFGAALVPGAVLLAAAYCLAFLALSVPALRHEKTASEREGEAASRLQQFLGGIEKIQMAGAEDHVLLASIEPVAGQQRASMDAGHTLGLRSALRNAGHALLAAALLLLLLRSGSAIPMGRLAAFGLAFGALTSAMLDGMNALLDCRLLAMRLARLRPLLEAEPEADTGGADDPADTLMGRITLEHVAFSYSPDSEPVLRDISFDIQPGEYVGLAGRSGSGKSTIFSLLLGFDSPQAGRVLFDGRDISALSRRALRRQMGVVLQDERLIAGSIYENVMITSRAPSRAAAEAALERVGLKAEIDAMPMGMDTVLNESFETLSGGQKQRILLARAMADGPRVLLLDEATSALDNLTQAAVCRSLRQMEATRLVISHRPAALEDCDRILVLDGGRIAEEGSYAQLYAARGLFYEMIRQQEAGFKEKEI